MDVIFPVENQRKSEVAVLQSIPEVILFLRFDAQILVGEVGLVPFQALRRRYLDQIPGFPRIHNAIDGTDALVGIVVEESYPENLAAHIGLQFFLRKADGAEIGFGITVSDRGIGGHRRGFIQGG